ncbi:hypothetical protein BU16DRAFT_459066 [Lophium mytilinum]|uniref:PH domain-containing protein n=1 Tax=Lophium mytilinum TaxID=390894 RepID=A0A6A6QXL9_9PEZI|nr:hypothetical protein BU16DRAFT_459066 [Lophium mytilinum]
MADVSTSTAPKFSRYRSVRRQQEQQLKQPPPPMPPLNPPKEASVSRSMSRYHRQRAGAAVNNAVPPIPDLPGMRSVKSQQTLPPPPPVPVPTHATSSPRLRSGTVGRHNAPQNISSEESKMSPSTGTAGKPVPLVKRTAREPSATAREEARKLMQGEAERLRRIKEDQRIEREALEARRAEQERSVRHEQEKQKALLEAERLKQLQEKVEEEERIRLQQEEESRAKRRLQEASRAKQHQEEEAQPKSRMRARTVGREQRPATSKGSPSESRPQTSSQKSLPHNSPSKLGFLKKKNRDDALRALEDRPKTSARPREISTSSGGKSASKPLAGFDAPISAVNAGDRRVMVDRNGSQILLPVVPGTTPLELIRSAANCLSVPIDPKGSVLLENFGKVGLTRPLRHYEHVRDVMNSWDRDDENNLYLVDASTRGAEEELSSSQVPTSKPEIFSCFIYYSQKPGKWAKKHFTLRPDGQILLAKNDAGKDSSNVCHLSDFDIYTPTVKKVSKVRPPKKICYAVKSQQKTAMFLDEMSFVHFFCTADKAVANAFYKAIQGWRSWYLVNVMGEGQKKAKTTEGTNGGGLLPTFGFLGGSPKDEKMTSHSRGFSVDSHYQLGSFKPLLDLSVFEKEEKKDNNGVTDDWRLPMDTKAMHSRKMSTRVREPPPPSGHATKYSQNSNRLNSLAQSTSSSHQSNGEEPFAATGLLGRQYSQRQKLLQEREQNSTSNIGPFTGGSNLISNVNSPYMTTEPSSGLGRKSSVRSTRQSSDLNRSASTRNKPKPLVDLTPQYREPPQHARKGKGFIPDTKTEPLVSSATSPEEAIKIPPSTDWRRPSTSANHGNYGSGNHERSRSLRGGPPAGLASYAVNIHDNVPQDESDAFTGRGLLANAGFSQGGVVTGRGIMDGSKAKGPMLGVDDRSQFVPGSLLSGVEKVQGSAGPIIDREKRHVADVATGEGM